MISKDEFEKAIRDLPFREPDLEAEVVAVETIDAEYFRNDRRQRCIIRRKNGSLFWSYYD